MAAQSSPSQKSLNSVVVEQQRVIVKNNYGENLVGVLHETGSTQVVILCHGFQSSKDSRINMSLAEVLTKQGISVFRFDFSGNGESEGTFQYGNYIKEADDLHSVVMHFLGMKHAVSAIVGHSKGGDVTKEEKSSTVTKESLMERLAIDMGACLSIGKDCRVLTVHGSADKIVPYEDASWFDKVIANHELQIVEGLIMVTVNIYLN
ncbi:hypothetical protein MKX01_004836 [Papaver californicum]|nr:hypothetical protein MKX01_004836 [Papaver californicum]